MPPRKRAKTQPKQQNAVEEPGPAVDKKEDSETNEMMISQDNGSLAAAHAETGPTPRKSGRRAEGQAAAGGAGNADADMGQHKQRHSGRRKAGGGGATSAQTHEEMAPTSAANAHEKKGKGSSSKASADSDVMMDAVVKVYCIHTEPYWSLPWQKKRQYSSSSSGFVIRTPKGHLAVLTNAHCVEFATNVKVKRRGSDTKFIANVVSVGAECDMAMLTVEDPSFFEGVTPVTFGSLPRLQDAVTVVGYPIGGDTMSVTSGVVSRIEVTSYVHGATELLGVQIDAAINSGNSGGPAFNDAGLCVGIAFQSLKGADDAENIGYIIPIPVVQHFINDIERHSAYTGFPALGIEWQKMENPDLRTSLGMAADQKGVLVRRVEPTSAASKVLSQGDILMTFDGVNIANDGTVPFRTGERISFSYLVSQKYTGDECTLRVQKPGKQVQELKVQLQPPVKLIPVHTRGLPPSYFIVAGLVFTPATVPYLKSEYGREYDFDAPVKLLEKMVHAMAETEDQQVVVLSQVLADAANLGYEDITNTQVLSVNGSKVRNMRDLVRLVESCTSNYLEFELEYAMRVVLDAAKARGATNEILATHCIAADRSQDLVTV